MPQFDDILQLIEKSINRFNRRIPSTQKDMLSAIEEDLRDLDLNSGKIKATVKNLSIIARIKNRLTKIILTDDYKAEVKHFAEAFNDVTNLQNQYWKQVESTFKPFPLLREIKNITIEDTVNKLLDSGINANIADPIADILRTNITTGGSYSALTDQLRTMLTDTQTPGFLSKYAKSLTIDSLNQYNRNYTNTVSSDLNFSWYRYANSLIDSSRPFCQSMVEERKYFHVSEIPALLRAENMFYTDNKGVRKAVPIYQKTGLPNGMYPNTNASNFMIYLGGFSCGHSAQPVSESLVPADIISRVQATPAFIRWKNLNQKAIPS
jgi:hypothetical protein